MKNNLRNVFESSYGFEEAFENFKEITSEEALEKYIKELVIKPRNKAGFVWQVKGNHAAADIERLIKGLDFGYAEILASDARLSIEDIEARRKEYHIYSDIEDAMNDDTIGFIHVVNFPVANEEIVKFVLSLIKGNGEFNLASGWRVICSGNIESGETIWQDSFKTIFINKEYSPKTKSQLVDYDDDEMYDSAKTDDSAPKVNESNVSGYVNLLKRAYSNGDLNEGVRINLSKDGIEIKGADEQKSVSESNQYWYGAAKFIDLETGTVNEERLADALEREGIFEAKAVSKKNTEKLYKKVSELMNLVDDSVFCAGICTESPKLKSVCSSLSKSLHAAAEKIDGCRIKESK